MILEFLKLIESLIVENTATVVVVMAIVQHLKGWLKSYEWYQDWYITVLAFGLAFAFAIPAGDFEWVEFVARGLGIGAVATGVYDIWSEIKNKVVK